jgi:MOSC domain-containing protein YiiM
MKIEIVRLYTSPGHNFFGRHGLTPLQNAMEEQEEVHCVEGRGIRGDRFFEYKDDYKGQITFLADEVYQSLCRNLRIFDKTADVLRRNVVTRGIDLNEWIGKEFEIQGVHFLGTVECSPCYWMNHAFGPGAEEFLKGRGGLRARILSSGLLTNSQFSPARYGVGGGQGILHSQNK